LISLSKLTTKLLSHPAFIIKKSGQFMYT